MRTLIFATATAFLALATPATAATVLIDLSGATTGTIVTGTNATFAQRFAGQTVAGAGLTGTPTNPLTLSAAGSISVAFFDPGVSAASNSLLSQPGNVAPLAVLLGSLANSFTFTMGSSDPGSTVDVRAFDANGGLTGSTTVNMLSGYNIYTLTGLGNFKGLSFFNNNDPAGVRFQNMSYNSVTVNAVPEPATWGLMLAGFGIVGGALRHRRRIAVRFA